MIGRQEQILAHEQLSATQGLLGGTVFTSKIFPYGGERGFVVMTKLGAAVTGTTPGLVVALQGSLNGGAYTTLGSAGASLATATSQANLITAAQLDTFFTGITSGALLKVIVTAGNADNVCTDVSIDVVAFY